MTSDMHDIVERALTSYLLLLLDSELLANKMSGMKQGGTVTASLGVLFCCSHLLTVCFAITHSRTSEILI